MTSPLEVSRRRLMLGRLKAYSMLAVSFVLALVSRWLRFGSRFGLAAYQRNYAADRLGLMQPQDADVIVAAGRCIACARCEVGDAEVRRRHSKSYPGLMTLVLAGARTTTDAVEAANSWSLLDQDDLRRRERLCPTNVPLLALSEFVRRHARELAGHD